MRSVILGVLLFPALALAQPGPAPAPMPEQEAEIVPEPSSFALRAGVGFARYGEAGGGWSWKSDMQPFAIVGSEGAFPLGRGHLVLQGQAGFGSEVGMTATGQLSQTNDFHQEIFEGSPRYRHPINARLYFEGGYRFTYQRLHFTDITNANGNLGDADEYVSVHAFEGGLGWRRTSLDGSRRHVAFTIGLNRGSAENSRITGATLHARGVSFDLRGGKRWASGMQLEGQFAYRKQNGSSPTTAMFDGMEVSVMWPKNTTMQLLVVLGFAL
jgi:hypothetical protein